MSVYKIGKFICSDSPVIINAGRRTAQIIVTNLGDRSIQIGSHYHFFEVNKALLFDREKAFGMRLDIPSGTAVRFEPGEEKQADLVEYAGKKVAMGFNGLTMGDTTDARVRENAIKKAKELGFIKE